MKHCIFLILSFLSLETFSQDTSFIKVHFLYGSRPYTKYRDTEKKWFGGVLGGHVGVQGDSVQILNFVHRGSFHVFSSKTKRHSAYKTHTTDGFYSIFGGDPEAVKKAIVYIPVTAAQKHMFDSISAAYLKETPYDYALVGMRCGAATYEILSRIGILPEYSYRSTYWKIFYPKKLRKRLFKKAQDSGWHIERQEGSAKRRWERD